MMYTIGKYLGNGCFSYFFTLRRYNKLGVKVREDNNKKKLEKEMAKAQILRKLGVPVPKFVGIVPVKIPEYFGKTLKKQELRGEIKNDKSWYLRILQENLPKLAGRIFWGSIMEIVDQDMTLVSRDRVAYHYKKEAEKIKNLGIGIKDSEVNKNVLWSKRKAKLYFIDFDMWIIPKGIMRSARKESFFRRLWDKLLGE